MKTFRQILFDSHVAAVAIAVLLVWSLSCILEGLWPPVFSAISFAMTAIAIRGLPFIPSRSSFSTRLIIFLSCDFLLRAFACVLAAWILSRWVYGMGPLSSLAMCRARLARRNHA